MYRRRLLEDENLLRRYRNRLKKLEERLENIRRIIKMMDEDVERVFRKDNNDAGSVDSNAASAIKNIGVCATARWEEVFLTHSVSLISGNSLLSVKWLRYSSFMCFRHAIGSISPYRKK